MKVKAVVKLPDGRRISNRELKEEARRVGRNRRRSTCISNRELKVKVPLTPHPKFKRISHLK